MSAQFRNSVVMVLGIVEITQTFLLRMPFAVHTQYIHKTLQTQLICDYTFAVMGNSGLAEYVLFMLTE